MLSRAEFRGGLLALGALLVLVLAILTVTPGIPGDLLLQSVRFHLIITGFVLWLLILISGARWRSLFLLIPLLAATAHGGYMMWELFSRRTPIAGPPAAELDFLSFNVLAYNRRSADLVDSIIANPPDVALILETPGIEEHIGRLRELLPYQVGCSRTQTCDIAIFSRLPMEDAEIRTLPPFNNERFVMARVTKDGQPVTIVGVHLSKPYFDRSSWGELNYIRNVVDDIEGPVVLAGDFNSAAWTDTVGWTIEALDLVPGPWTPATWPVRAGPLGVPIDNVFTRGSARLLTLEAGDNLGSNHRPLRGIVGLYGS
ncbi:MAG: hypothetical protein GX970_13390 [Phyllobacteriaceae bacterium]|nr:hypothetical protein [Phyllobacteriaceae bacterium]